MTSNAPSNTSGMEEIQSQIPKDAVDVRAFPGINPHGAIDESKYQEIVGTAFIKQRSSEHAGDTLNAETSQSNATSVGLTGVKPKMVHGPLIGSSETCKSLIEGVQIANQKILQGPKCRKWFDDRGPVSGPFYVMVQRYKLACLTSAPTWTFPYYHEIGFCEWACDKNADYIASLLIHELGHHYCSAFTMNREACAVSAQDTCDSD